MTLVLEHDLNIMVTYLYTKLRTKSYLVQMLLFGNTDRQIDRHTDTHTYTCTHMYQTFSYLLLWAVMRSVDKMVQKLWFRNTDKFILFDVWLWLWYDNLGTQSWPTNYPIWHVVMKKIIHQCSCFFHLSFGCLAFCAYSHNLLNTNWVLMKLTFQM